MQVKTEMQDAADADAFIVCVYDPEAETRTYSGPFADPVHAMAYADRHLEQVNRGLAGEDQPWTATVEILTWPDSPPTTTDGTTMSIVKGDDWFDTIDHDAIMDAMTAAGLSVSWDFPGMVRIELDPTTAVATGLHGYEYGSVSVLVDNMWDESTEAADVDVAEGETDPKTIADAWATWVTNRAAAGPSSSSSS